MNACEVVYPVAVEPHSRHVVLLQATLHQVPGVNVSPALQHRIATYQQQAKQDRSMMLRQLLQRELQISQTSARCSEKPAAKTSEAHRSVAAARKGAPAVLATARPPAAPHRPGDTGARADVTSGNAWQKQGLEQAGVVTPAGMTASDTSRTTVQQAASTVQQAATTVQQAASTHHSAPRPRPASPPAPFHGALHPRTRPGEPPKTVTRADVAGRPARVWGVARDRVSPQHLHTSGTADTQPEPEPSLALSLDRSTAEAEAGQRWGAQARAEPSPRPATDERTVPASANLAGSSTSVAVAEPPLPYDPSGALEEAQIGEGQRARPPARAQPKAKVRPRAATPAVIPPGLPLRDVPTDDSLSAGAPVGQPLAPARTPQAPMQAGPSMEVPEAASKAQRARVAAPSECMEGNARQGNVLADVCLPIDANEPWPCLSLFGAAGGSAANGLRTRPCTGAPAGALHSNTPKRVLPREQVAGCLRPCACRPQGTALQRGGKQRGELSDARPLPSTARVRGRRGGKTESPHVLG